MRMECGVKRSTQMNAPLTPIDEVREGGGSPTSQILPLDLMQFFSPVLLEATKN